MQRYPGAGKQGTSPGQREVAFQAGTAAMRKAGGVLTRPQLEQAAFSALRAFDHTGRSDADFRKQAASVAKSIAQNFDLKKGRPPAKENRAYKHARKEEILKAYFSSKASGATKSVRQLARMFGISPTAVQRILTANSPRPRAHQLYMSTSAIGVCNLLADHMPFDGHRLVDDVSLRNLLSISWEQLAEISLELDELKQPLRLLLTELPAMRGDARWVIVARGRNKSESALRKWATATSNHLQKNSSRRLDQRKIIKLDVGSLPQNPVLKDVTALLMVVFGSISLGIWRRFIAASAGVTGLFPNGLQIKDHEGLLTALNGAFRIGRMDYEEIALRVPAWIPDPPDRYNAAELLGLVEELRQLSHSPWLMIDRWMFRTDYKTRVDAGDLPGRSSADADSLSFYRSISDPGDLIDQFKAQPAEMVIPMWPSVPKMDLHLCRQVDALCETDDDDDDDEEFEGEESDGYIYGPDEDDS